MGRNTQSTPEPYQNVLENSRTAGEGIEGGQEGGTARRSVVCLGLISGVSGWKLGYQVLQCMVWLVLLGGQSLCI